MKIFASVKKNNHAKGQNEKMVVTFAHLSKSEQEKAIKKGAEHFSKYFAKSFEKLAKE